ncbi:DUF6415 family natural product biosynthesis protein [Streptomyces sp. NPDC002845]
MTGIMSEADADGLPLDLKTMRAATDRVLARGAEPLSDEDLETLRLQLRGHIELLIPTVERAAVRRPKGWDSRDRALSCAGEARVLLRVGRGDTLFVRVSVVHRLARLVRRPCGHLEDLGGECQ